MRTNEQGVTLIHGCESLELEAYPDPGSALYKACQRQRINPLRGGYRRLRGWESLDGGPWTIGYGDTGPDVVPGLVITAEEAEERFVRRLEGEFEPGVEQLLEVEVTENQFSALVSFAYNVGLGFPTERNPKGSGFYISVLRHKLNAGDIEGAVSEFARWNRSGGRVMPGLVKRRQAEAELFLTPDGDLA